MPEGFKRTDEETVSNLALLKNRFKQLKAPFIKAVLLFGSRARAESRKRSDVDLLVLHKGHDVEDIVVRRRMIYRIIKEAIGEDFEGLTVIDMDLNDFLKPKEVTPLLLNIYWDARVVYDKTGKIEDFLKYVRDRIVRSGLRRVRDGKAYYWVLPEPMREVRIL